MALGEAPPPIIEIRDGRFKLYFGMRPVALMLGLLRLVMVTLALLSVRTSAVRLGEGVLVLGALTCAFLTVQAAGLLASAFRPGADLTISSDSVVWRTGFGDLDIALDSIRGVRCERRWIDSWPHLYILIDVPREKVAVRRAGIPLYPSWALGQCYNPRSGQFRLLVIQKHSDTVARLISWCSAHATSDTFGTTESLKQFLASYPSGVF